MMDSGAVVENPGAKVDDLTKPEGAPVNKGAGLGFPTNGVAEPVSDQTAIISAPEVTPSVNGTAPVTAPAEGGVVSTPSMLKFDSSGFAEHAQREQQFADSVRAQPPVAPAEQPFVEPAVPQITAQDIENATRANSAKGLELAGKAKDNVSLQYDQARAELAELISSQGGKIGGEGYDKAVDKITQARRQLDFANERYTNTLNTAVADKDSANRIRESVMRESHPDTFGMNPVAEPATVAVPEPPAAVVEPVVPVAPVTPEPVTSAAVVTPTVDSEYDLGNATLTPDMVHSTYSNVQAPAVSAVPAPDNSLPAPEPAINRPAGESLVNLNLSSLLRVQNEILDKIPTPARKNEIMTRAGRMANEQLANMSAEDRKKVTSEENFKMVIENERKILNEENARPQEEKALEGLNMKNLKKKLEDIWENKIFKTVTEQNEFHRNVDRIVETQLGMLSADERKKIEGNPEAKMKVIIRNARNLLDLKMQAV